MCECDNIRSMDVRTPKNVYLSAFYRRSFAFHTVKNRMPVIITSLVDNLVRNKEEIGRKYGDEASEELKKVIGVISKLKYEVQTNKPLTPLVETTPDTYHYNQYIAKQATEEGHTTHFNTIWLLTECYMYRRIRQAFELQNHLKHYDPFRKQKEEAYTKSIPLMEELGKYLLEHINNDITLSKDTFISFLKLNLWGNKCDLSISLGKHAGHTALFDTAALESNILADHSETIWDAVSNNNDSDIIDFILDNSGYEVFTDMCLADYIISKNLAKQIRFFVKTIPWFISDVMRHDFHWMIKQLNKDDTEDLQTLGRRWETYVSEGKWQVVEDDFWTYPYDFTYMATVKPELYKKLSESKVAFFKGDLNYRKLFGEKNWEASTSVEEGLQGFHPTRLCILRTIKADIVCGIKEGVAEKLDKEEPKWMETGDYGLIQYCGKIVKID